MNDFLPKDYEVPDKGGSYMKFVKGENRFRVLNSPILGYEGWKTAQDDSRHPVRKRMSQAFIPSEIDDLEETKHFWALPVYNYQAKAVQLLEITQRSVQKSLRALAKDTDWGDPREYDLVVVRDGDGMETRYEVMPKPKKPIDAGIMKTYEDMDIKLEALFDGADPFAQTKNDESAQLAEDADKALNGQNATTPF